MRRIYRKRKPFPGEPSLFGEVLYMDEPIELSGTPAFKRAASMLYSTFPPIQEWSVPLE